MTERSGAERQPRDQDAGVRQHPQSAAAVLAGQPRSVQGRHWPGAAPRPPPRTATLCGPAAAERSRRPGSHTADALAGMCFCQAAGWLRGEAGACPWLSGRPGGSVGGGDGWPWPRDLPAARCGSAGRSGQTDYGRGQTAAGPTARVRRARTAVPRTPHLPPGPPAGLL